MKTLIPFLGLLCIYTSAVLGATNKLEKMVNCENRTAYYFQHTMLFQDHPTCCKNEQYYLWSSSEYLKHYKTCNVEPKNQTMSLEDSHWAAYDCIIRKALGSKELNVDNYIELIAGKLSKSKKTDIKSLAKESKTPEIKSNGNRELNQIKKLWKQYFDAEYQVCAQSTASSQSEIEVVKRFWEPTTSCLNGKIPQIPTLPFTAAEVENCLATLKERYPMKFNATGRQSFANMLDVSCSLIAGHLLTEKDLSITINYESVVKSVLPQFISKSVRQQILETFVNTMGSKYLNANQSETATSTSTPPGIQQIAIEVMKLKEKVVGENTDKMAYINILTIDEITRGLALSIFNICERPDRRQTYRA